jgi:predicted lipoprotein with Yx(FWY)xxD motif
VRSKILTMTVAGALILALGACGDDGDSTSTADQGSQSEEAGSGGGASESGAVVEPGETDLGQVLTTGDGMTVYGFMLDTGGMSTCEGSCAEEWPPVTVESQELPAGLDDAVFSVVERSDGTFQLVAGDWPLYTFAGDRAAGDVNGQGADGVWFAVAPDGQLTQGQAGTGGGDSGTDSGGTGGGDPSDPYAY